MKYTEELKEFIFTAICSFIEDDGFSHFSLANLNISHLGINTLHKILRVLVSENRLEDYTVNGFYNRYLTHDPVQCPDFIFNDLLSLPSKLFIFECYNLLDDYSYKKCSEMLRYFPSMNYHDIAKRLSNIKKSLGCDLFSYLGNISYIHNNPFHTKYHLVKTENGYQVDSNLVSVMKRSMDESQIHEYYKKERLRKINKLIEEKGIGFYLMKKLMNRIRNNERFTDYDLDAEFLDNLFKEQNGCDFYTGMKFSDLSQVSIDRINSEKTYTKDNVVLTTSQINRMKSEYSLEEFLILCNKVSKHFPIIGIK